MTIQGLGQRLGGVVFSGVVLLATVVKSGTAQTHGVQAQLTAPITREAAIKKGTSLQPQVNRSQFENFLDRKGVSPDSKKQLLEQADRSCLYRPSPNGGYGSNFNGFGSEGFAVSLPNTPGGAIEVSPLKSINSSSLLCTQGQNNNNNRPLLK